jgi:hypothetical protein
LLAVNSFGNRSLAAGLFAGDSFGNGALAVGNDPRARDRDDRLLVNDAEGDVFLDRELMTSNLHVGMVQ